MQLLPPPSAADLAFLTITTTGVANYTGRESLTTRPSWHYWQFMYTLSGEGSGDLAGTPLRARPGSVWLLPRDQPHHYRRQPMARVWTYRWIEIDGAAVPALLRMLGFDRQPCVHDCAGIEGRLAEVVSTLDGSSVHHRHEATALFLQVLAQVAARRSDSAPAASSNRRLVARAQRLLAQHVRIAISLEEIAQCLGVSPAHLIRSFHREYGMSPMKYLAKLRVNHAQRLLATGSASISQIGAEIGYARVQHFSRMFKRETGLSPLDYRRGVGRTG